MKKKIAGLFFVFIILLMTSSGTASSSIIQIVNVKEPADPLSENSLSVLPSYFSWRDINGTDYTTPIRNQAPFASCETFALVAAVETMVQIEIGYPFGCDLSEAHLYFYSGGNLNWGSFPENDTNFLRDYGVPDEACWPYPKEKKLYPLNTTSPDWQNRTVRISNWTYLPEDPDAIKSALVNNGPVPTYFVVYDDFLKHKKGIYRHRWGDVRGIHYVTIVGYNDAPGYWIVKNSWGKKYQDEGWFNIKYGECSIEKKSFLLTGVKGQLPIIYVDDDNTVGPWNGSRDHPFQTIQEGINHAIYGWTVFVFNGTYNENIIINKTINVDGENPVSTIIDGGGKGHVVEVSSPSVRISGFTIQNSGKEPFETGIKTLSLDSNITIQNNIIQNNGLGVFLNYAYEGSGNVVVSNIIQDNSDGIYIHWANNNQIINNHIISNQDDGIEMEASQHSQIVNNVIQNNGKYGLYLRAASHRNTIKQNDFVDNENQAFFDGSILNRWYRNYWSDSHRVLVKPIRGRLDIFNIPWIDYDILPKRRPNNG
jgi:parallel beta-helix repeat protein